MNESEKTPYQWRSEWNSEERKRWTTLDYLAYAKLLIGQHVLHNAQEVLLAALELWPRDIELRRWLGLAYSRASLFDQAIVVLQSLYDEGVRDDETVGKLAASYKRLGLLQSPGSTTFRDLLQKSLALYREAYSKYKNLWLGINVCTVENLLDELEASSNTAREVLKLCDEEFTKPGGSSNFWLLATYAEAYLNLGQLEQAGEWFAKARSAIGSDFGNLNTARRQIRSLLEHLEHDVTLVQRWLPMPPVIVFAGHMLDRSDRQYPRFPATLSNAVGNTIRKWVAEHVGRFGFSSAACGGDILFQEALKDTGAERYIILPFPEEVFKVESVNFAEAGAWENRFEAVLKGTSRIIRASRTPLRDASMAYEYANLILLGLARSRAAELDTNLIALVLWDGKQGDGIGGTSSFVEHCLRLQVPVHSIDLSAPAVSADGLLNVRRISNTCNTGAKFDETDFGAVLFADAVGFSKLPDQEVPMFVNKFLMRIGNLVESYGSNRIPVKETWGDGLFFAFHTLEDAALFALDLSQLVNGTDWQAEGFSFPLCLRTALHHGPIYHTQDPITKLPKVTGAHVAQAARLEPKTPPGQVYATEAFAARAALEGLNSFRCTFVKQLEFDKRYGTFPTYVISRT